MENIKKRLRQTFTRHPTAWAVLALTVIFAVLALRGDISGTEFLTIFTVVIGFYFGTQRVAEDKNG